MNKLPLAKRAQVLTLLCEGVSMRSIERIVGCSINTVDKLLRDAGEAALAYHDKAVRGVKAQRIRSGTTSSVSTRRCGPRPRWRPGSKAGYGRWTTWLRWSMPATRRSAAKQWWVNAEICGAGIWIVSADCGFGKLCDWKRSP